MLQSFQTNPRGVEAADGIHVECPRCRFRRTLVGLKRTLDWPAGYDRSFRRTLVGFKPAVLSGDCPPAPGFRRTLVGLKRALRADGARPDEFQTNPRGVEAA